MGPPSSGGLTVAMILGLLERFDLGKLTPGSVEAEHLFAEAARLAYADRALYMADADFVAVPVAGLLDRTYLDRRGRSIDAKVSMGKAAAGTPPEKKTERRAPDDALELPSTSHISIVDSLGNAVSMTTSIESAFGSRLMVRGFLLNNQLTDFSFQPARDGVPVANRVEAGKRPRSSMAPTIVLGENGDLRLVVGSPGGSRIINYVARAVSASVDWGMDIQTALSRPHVVNRNGAVDLEEGTAAEALKPGLEALGHKVKIRALTSGLHAIAVIRGGYDGAADPRREGLVLGE
jgi:gamma-glutamyltranspeptidase/glutathione hydrolase